MTPQGRVFNQSIAEELAKEENLVFLCGHYEGIDERALELIQAEYLSAGDFVLTGGELPSMVMIDCISRLVPGVLGNGVLRRGRVFLRQSAGISSVFQTGRVAREKSSAGAFVGTSCKHRKMEKRTVDSADLREKTGSS